MQKLPISKEKIAELLNRVTEGGSLRKIAKDVGINHTTVFTYMEALPLWKAAHGKARTED